MSEKYDFSEGIQARLVSMLLYDDLSLINNLEIIKPEFFDHTVFQGFVSVIFSFYEKYKKGPDLDEYLEEVQLEMERRKIPADEWTDAFEEVIRLGEKGEFQYVKDRAVEFARFQAVRDAVIKGAKLLTEKKDYSPILDDVKEAMGIGENQEDLGDMYFENIEERLLARRDLTLRSNIAIPTGINKLDSDLGGGVAPGELAIFMSPMKRGKTMSIVCFSKGALYNGKNVLHIGMEGSRDRTQNLYDASISGVTKEMLHVSENEVRTAVTAFKNSPTSGKLWVQHYPAQGCSALTIEALMQKLKFLHKFQPDMLVIDYLGLMRSSNKKLLVDVSSGGRYHLLGAITKELLALAQQHKIAVWLLHQTTRGSKSKDIIDLDDSGDSIEPMRDADLILTLNQTKQEADPDINPQDVRIFIAGGREMKDRKQVNLKIDKAKCQLYEAKLVEDTTGLVDR